MLGRRSSAADGCGRGFLVAYAVPILNPDLPSWLVELYRSLSWSPGVLHHRLRVRIFLADERLRYLVRDWDDRDCPTSGPAAAASRLIPLLSVLNWRVRIRPRGRVAIYMAGWPGRDLCGRVAPPLLAFCSALAVLDVERSRNPQPSSPSPPRAVSDSRDPNQMPI